jgi:phosphate transport system substrate-binding protein
MKPDSIYPGNALLNGRPWLILLPAILVIFAMMVSSCASQQKRERTISISGAWAIYPLVIKWAEEYRKENPDIRFNISGGGAGKGMADALAGVVDLGMFSREITQEEKDRGAWWVALTIDAVLPTINSDNPHLERIKKRGLTRDEFRGLFIEGTIREWTPITGIRENARITVYTRSDACGAAETWASYIGGHQENIKGIGIFGDPGLADAVASDRYGVGYNNTIFLYDIRTGKKRQGIEVIPIDINGNGKIDPEEEVYDTFSDILGAIADRVYPYPPARELYLVAGGRPRKQSVVDFLRWTLTEGQKYVAEAGYVPIDEERIQEQLKKLE